MKKISTRESEKEISKETNAKTYSEWRKTMTDEELVSFCIENECEYEEVKEGEECIIKDILKILGTKKYSVMHSIHLLEVAKKVLCSIARFEF